MDISSFIQKNLHNLSQYKMNINLQSEKFKQELTNFINNSNLPIANVFYIIQLIQQQLKQTYYNVINNQIRKEQQASQKQEEQQQTEQNKEEEE